MAISQAVYAARLRAQMLAKQRARKRVTITTATEASRQRTAQIKSSKGLKRRRRKWAIKSSIQKLLGREFSSSFVSSLTYDPQTGNADALLSGRKYRFFSVPEAIFVSWTKGAATCQTSDDSGQKRWDIGKTPSLGAFFNHYIKNKYGWVRM